MREIDVNPTAKIIETMSKKLIRASKDLDLIREKMIDSKDITYASEVLITITNLIGAMRLDLLITRPIRELTRK